MDVCVSLLGPVSDGFGGEGSDFRREIFELYEFRAELIELRGYDNHHWIQTGLINLAEALDELLHVDVQVGESVKSGQVIGSWCGEDIIAPKSGSVGFSLSGSSRGDPHVSSDIDFGTDAGYSFPDADALAEDHIEADFIDAAVDHKFEFVVAIIAVGVGAEDEGSLPGQEGDSREMSPPASLAEKVPSALDGGTPKPVLIRHPRDAEEAAARWMRYWGWTDARTTPPGADEGIDVVAKLAVAQVKAHMSPVGRPDVQNLFGVASAEKKSALFFSLTDYTAEAKSWANKAGVGLFRFDLQGEPEPVNYVARQLINDQQAQLSGR